MRSFLALALLAASAAAQPMPATIEIDAARPASYTIPRTIFGTFLEPIGRSIYPGLWAQELQNPSFEDNLWSAGQIRRMLDANPALARASGLGLPLPWEPLDAAQGERYEPRWGDAANSHRSLLLMALPHRETGVRQEVFLPVHRVLRYTGSFWAKGDAAIDVSIRKRNHMETVLARASVPVSDADWARYEFALELPQGALARLEPADFVLAASDERRVLIDQALLFPADNVAGMDPDMLALCRALKSPLVRYGGNFTSGYHWRDGIGPIDKRVTMLNQAWGMPEYNHFGTDEFLEFCNRLGAAPQIALNLGSGSPEEAAGWVRYVNARWGDRSGGLLWELGNELWGNFQIGYPTLQRVAPRTKAFSDAVRAVDSGARLIATGQDPDRFREWNAAQLANAPGAFDYLSTHFVVGTNVRRAAPTSEFIAQASFALPVGLERALREMKAQIDADQRARGRVKIAFTEWLFHGNTPGVPYFNNLGGAICAAGFLNTLMRVADFTPIADMTGLVEFGGVWKKRGQAYGVPAYWAFRMYSTADATRPVETRTAVETYDVHEGNVRIGEIPGVPYLDVVAALNNAGDRLTLFCVNRHLTREIAAEMKISGFTPAAEARAQTLTAATLSAANDENTPEAVHPAERTVDFRGAYTFAPLSVTVIELRKSTA